ncbi:Uncharacterised protein [Mycobacteroides abscessus]|nr:Uncharacterised protein [Mycobacteroides abscessus]
MPGAAPFAADHGCDDVTPFQPRPYMARPRPSWLGATPARRYSWTALSALNWRLAARGSAGSS